MTITAEQAQWLADGIPPPLERDPAEWITDLARALIASEAARKLAEERLAAIVWSYDVTHTFRTADMHYDCKCLRCAVDAARAILKDIGDD